MQTGNKGNCIALIFAVVAGLVLVMSGCSKETVTYDDVSASGEIEILVRKQYKDFFKAIGALGTPSTETPDSVRMKKAVKLTDRLIEDLRPFPTTYESRISLDAISYAANDLTLSPAFSSPEVGFYWRNALIDPIFFKGNEYIKSEKTNESTIMQLVHAMKRGMGDQATDDMLLDVIKIVGPAPSDSVMNVCRADSLVLKKVYDLIVYTRSLQKIGPPIWMMAGSWLLALDFEDLPLRFYAIKPLDLNGSLYLTFKDFPLGDVYSSLYDDPAPTEPSEMDAWLGRAAAAVDSLRFDSDFAARASKSDLPVYDTHNYFNDYQLAATVNTVKTEFRIIFKREKVEQGPFQYAGADSITILLTEREIRSPADDITPLIATRNLGDGMMNGRIIKGQNAEGMAFIMPMGYHDENITRKLREGLMPTITVNGQ